ncbi:hypothetical protein M427DRAFT_131113 [Gonapodya prolifera JEL478]|uniref:Nudix hydrolase domain-containing protein n=1 Tax=Gonapodya prolifera (strain JEL478) TaxID=1344416 RepID=A0A139AW21_GONPJ|nr:hypothetical protein M427DRAFT_131113 [Gonapodya prolifera JEL478]|eukprot:KXS20941.1 hypothetical protein M427DRAFT_131113 [Gonapodya prolifera JEL478]
MSRRLNRVFFHVRPGCQTRFSSTDASSSTSRPNPPTGYSTRPDIPTFHDTPLESSPPLPFFKFDPLTLQSMEEKLREYTRGKLASGNHTLSPQKYRKEAGVLVPLCVVDGKPSVLLTVRNTRLRNHTGEIALPGGVRDPEDSSIEQTALRETFEEIYIRDSRVRLMGTLPPVSDIKGSTKVSPTVGFVDLPKHPRDLLFSKAEVSRVFHLTVEQLLDPARQKLMNFRGAKERISVFRADDTSSYLPEIPILPAPTSSETLPEEYRQLLESHEAMHGSTIVWGLTAYILSTLLREVIVPTVEEARLMVDRGENSES